MGYFRFRRRLKILPGVHLNLGNRGINIVSFGESPATVNFGRKGMKGTLSLPGSGLSYITDTVPYGSRPQQPQLPGPNQAPRNLGCLGAIGMMATIALIGSLFHSSPHATATPVAQTQTGPSETEKAANWQHILDMRAVSPAPTPVLTQTQLKAKAEQQAKIERWQRETLVSSTATPTPEPTVRRAQPVRHSHRHEVTVWVNTDSDVYHYPGSRWYGRTDVGKYEPESQAIAEGAHAASNGQ